MATWNNGRIKIHERINFQPVNGKLRKKKPYTNIKSCYIDILSFIGIKRLKRSGWSVGQLI